uniref:BCL-6 corepressor PCGF1 binding domain-containing protein n=1 Tax=Cyprinodon variegatus TaxID=28743 RepID=A0A3Q2CXG7_CYPVA
SEWEASTCRQVAAPLMNPLAALSMDPNTLVIGTVPPHRGMILNGVHSLSKQKQPDSSLQRGSDLQRKPTVPVLENQKSGSVELYRSPTPELQEVLLVSAAETNGLGLNHGPAVIDKQSEGSLNGAGSFFSLPWVSPYMDPSSYPFLDMAYRTSLLSALPFTPKPLAYQSLCANGSSTSRDERLFFISPYSAAQLVSSLAAPSRTSPANPTRSVLSPLPHGQEKTLQGFGQQRPEERSAVRTSSQTLQMQTDPSECQQEDRFHSDSACRSTSTEGRADSGAHGSQPSDSLPQSQSISSPSTELQNLYYQSLSSTLTVLAASHHFYSSSQQSCSTDTGRGSTRDTISNTDKHSTHAKQSLSNVVPQEATKNREEKGNSAEQAAEFLNRFPSQSQALVNLEYSQPSQHMLVPNQKQDLKEAQALAVSSLNKTSNHGTICTVTSTGGSSSAISSNRDVCSQATSRAADNIQLVSTESTIGQKTATQSTVSAANRSTNIPKTKAEGPQVSPPDSRKSSKEDHFSRKHIKTPSNANSNDNQPDLLHYQRLNQENKNSSSQIYKNSHLPHGLGHSKRYVRYSVPDTMSMQRMSVPNNGYPHPVLLGNNSFNQSGTAVKHGHPYGRLTYESAEKIASMSTCSGFQNKEKNHCFDISSGDLTDDDAGANSKSPACGGGNPSGSAGCSRKRPNTEVPGWSMFSPRFLAEGELDSMPSSCSRLNPKEPTCTRDGKCPKVSRFCRRNQSLTASPTDPGSSLIGENGNSICKNSRDQFSNEEHHNAVSPTPSPTSGKTPFVVDPSFPLHGLNIFATNGDDSRVHDDPSPHVDKDLHTNASCGNEGENIQHDVSLLHRDAKDLDSCRKGQSNFIRQIENLQGMMGEVTPDLSVSRRGSEQSAQQVGFFCAALNLLAGFELTGFDLQEVAPRFLEQQLSEVNHRDDGGYGALHEACARGWLAIARLLIRHGADVNCCSQDGTRPLHHAVENDHVEVVRFLLACGADPTLTTYSGRGPLSMSHSAAMATFLEDYLSDIQGRSEGDPGICWEFHGSSVCEPANQEGAYNILADPPGPEEDEEDQEEDLDEEQGARREVFEFELSDRPLLPCYNIKVSPSEGSRNWLLLEDVLGRLQMTSRSFRRLFPQLNIQSVPADEFYRQASLSQLLTGPDEQELASLRSEVKEWVELVEATPELAAMLGSSHEFVDSRLDASRPPAPPPRLIG